MSRPIFNINKCFGEIMHNPILFLDFDGVLNSEASFRMEHRLGTADVSSTLSAIACSNLQYILDKVPKLQIVISSTWRLHYSFEELKQILSRYGVDSERVIGITPPLLNTHRGHEIHSWLEDHLRPKKIVIIDDDQQAALAPHDLFILTSWKDGLLFSQAERIVRFLLGKKKDPTPLEAK